MKTKKFPKKEFIKMSIFLILNLVAFILLWYILKIYYWFNQSIVFWFIAFSIIPTVIIISVSVSRLYKTSNNSEFLNNKKN